jgi:hypothetical protein
MHVHHDPPSGDHGVAGGSLCGNNSLVGFLDLNVFRKSIANWSRPRGRVNRVWGGDARSCFHAHVRQIGGVLYGAKLRMELVVRFLSCLNFALGLALGLWRIVFYYVTLVGAIGARWLLGVVIASLQSQGRLMSRGCRWLRLMGRCLKFCSRVG